MSPVSFALRRPITVLLSVALILFAAAAAVTRMHRDTLPGLDLPILYVAQPFSGMDPSQMEGYLTYYYESHFLFIGGIEHIESKNIQSTAVIRLEFHPGTDMAQATAETVNYVTRARAYMPDGTLPPYVIRFDEGSDILGKLVFSSAKRPLAEVQELALGRVRPYFTTLPGLAATPPFGASQRAVVVHVKPEKMRKYTISPYDIAVAVSEANRVLQSGNIIVGNLYPMVKVNSVVTDLKDLLDVPLRLGTYPTIFLRDVATIERGADTQTGYALANGRRAVYLPVIRRPEASSLEVVDLVRQKVPEFQRMLPDDVRVSYEFDESFYIRDAIGSLGLESLLGAVLAGLMVLLLLREARSALIVMIHIPCSLALALVALWWSRQTINLMTLGGLALGIGVLVDETFLIIENIHAHLSRGKERRRACLDAVLEVSAPGLLSFLCVLVIFIPSLFMSGLARALFVPLCLSVAFTLTASFVLSTSFVPVLCVWCLKTAPVRSAWFASITSKYQGLLGMLWRRRMPAIVLYVAASGALLFLLSGRTGTELFPRVDGDRFRVRMRAPTGSHVETTEAFTRRLLEEIRSEAGPSNLETSLAFVGTHPSSFPSNAIYLWTSGPHESVTDVTLRRAAGIDIPLFQERLRKRISEKIPEITISFEPVGVLSLIAGQGTRTSVEVQVVGSQLEVSRRVAKEIRVALSGIASLRDLQYGQVFEYPAVEVSLDRRAAGLLGLTASDIGHALIPSTSSSRQVLRNYWADASTGSTHQVQVEAHPRGLNSVLNSIRSTPIGLNGGSIALSRVADVTPSTVVGEYDRYNMQRIASVTANVFGEDLGHVGRRVKQALEPIERQLPKGMSLRLVGQLKPMYQVFRSLGEGLLIAMAVVFLLLTAYFESTRLSLTVLSSLPAALVGIGGALVLTDTTLNIESFMGAIMAVGVTLANAILLVTFAERIRLAGKDSVTSALEAAGNRLRGILMTTVVMIVGMTPMSLGIGDRGKETAPLGRALVGGLGLSTAATLTIVPLVFALLQRNRPSRGSSIHPDDEAALPVS